ncbi:hypothetical protein ACHAPE_005491 [Trichoderma viride]
MVFVRRYRKEIVNSAREKYIHENSIRSDVLGNPTAGMNVGDLISKWDLDLNLSQQDPNTIPNKKPDDSMDDNHYDNLDESDRATDSLPELSAYKDFISKHPAYEWLLRSIRKELYMDMPGDIQTDIRETILGHLPRAQSISRREAPSGYALTFTADWDPVTFLQEQKYKESPERAIERAITLTGSKTDAQAVTTAQYLKQIWPSSGIHLLHVVKHVVRDDDSIPFSYSLPDSTRLVVRSRGPEFKLEVTGTADAIAEIGEQLAWLGSALRSSPHETGIAIVGAFVSGIGVNPTSERTEGHAPTYFYNIGFDIDVINNTGETSNGQCWHQLFRSPVIVKGYPIPRRPMSNIGLEINLDTLASLAGTRHINKFNNKSFIKGFSIMLIPTRHSDNILLWHLLCSKNGDRVSYLDGKDIYADDVSLPDLEKSRHILGWSSSVNYPVGSADANYNISSSWLALLRQNHKLDGISISKARLIKSNYEAAIGKRDSPPSVSCELHREKLELLSEKYMVLWDVGCKRGWLVNGVNALLHLLRASLEINKTDELSYRFLFKPELFEEASSKPYTVSAAMEVLMNSTNLDMELYEEYEKDESGEKIKFRVHDRVNELFEALEKAIDYQSMIADVKKKYPKSAPRKNLEDLEGWDFKDIATKTHCERAQAIWPKHKWPKDISRPLPESTFSSLKDSGAVVFGHSASIGWIWNDFGDPEKGEPPIMGEETDDDDPPDSGLGSSNVYSLQHEDYHIAIICALSEELKAVRTLFNEIHQDLQKHESDANTYSLSRLGTHHMVAACLPVEEYSTNAASKVASDIKKSFPAVK